LVGTDLFVATARDIVGTEGHELRVLHCGRAEWTVRAAEGLALAIGVPVVVVLVVSVMLVERVVKIAVYPWELWNKTKINWHLCIIIRFKVVTSANRVKRFIKVWMDDSITKIVMWFLPKVLWEVWRIEVDSCHI
jgi:hypothetical protein